MANKVRKELVSRADAGCVDRAWATQNKQPRQFEASDDESKVKILFECRGKNTTSKKIPHEVHFVI